MLYYYPNRPLLVPPSFLSETDRFKGWVAERKHKGDRLVLQFTEGKFRFLNRHGGKEFKYLPPPRMIEELSYIIGLGYDIQLDGELMNFKTKITKNVIYLYDVYVWDGCQMKMTFEERRKFLEKKMDVGKFQHVVLTEQFTGNFKKLFDKLSEDPECEGLVLKDPKSRLSFDLNKSKDVAWQIKVRRPEKNYLF